MPETALMTIDSALPEAMRRGLDEFGWRTLANNLFPGAKPESVLMAIDYCKARNLDPMKKPCHIVPMEVKEGNIKRWRDVIMPGIYEYRTTAHRTGEYLGHSDPVYGPDVQFKNLTVPEWCELTVYRFNSKAQHKSPFPVRTYFREVVALTKDQQSQQWGPNSRWSRAPIQMMTKCCEAAALREAFPEELGGTLTEEEMRGQAAIDVDVTVPPEEIPPALEKFHQLPEGTRDAVEKAFTLLAMSAAQRLQKLNEYLMAPDAGDEAAESLLEWCRDEFARRKGQPRAKAADNGKKKRTSQPASAEGVSGAAARPAGSDGGDSDPRGAGPEALAEGSGPEAPPVQNSEVLFE